MGNVYLASPNNSQQLCFPKVFSKTNSLENKFESRPFLEHTGMGNIDLTSTNNTQQICFPKIFLYINIFVGKLSAANFWNLLEWEMFIWHLLTISSNFVSRKFSPRPIF